jgi:nucleoside phosphorylase/pimeloyl-ACP methyl ester carboxylesterase
MGFAARCSLAVCCVTLIGKSPHLAATEGRTSMAHLEQVHHGDSTQVAIVFLHGMGGHLFDTWTGPASSRDDCWPHWVGQDLDCDTWTLGYDAALSRWQDQAMPLPDQGTQVAQLLAVHPGLKERALVLVGHSLGGLVIKTLITQARAAGDTRTRALLDRIRGVVFVATPHHGSQLANLAMAITGARTNAQISSMRLHDAHLRQLGAAFREQRRVLRLKIAAFAEGRDVMLKPTGFFGLLTKPVGIRVVDPTSGDAALDGVITVPLAEDHFSICKPASRDAQIHHALLAFVRDEVLADLTVQQHAAFGQQVGAPKPSTPAPSQTPTVPTFIDHCVVNPRWIATASSQAAMTSFDWHPKVAKALDLIAANARDFDRNVYGFPNIANGDAASDISHRKVAFFKNQAVLLAVVEKATRVASGIIQGLRDFPPEMRSRALHTFAAAASLRVIRLIQRFEGTLFSEAGQLIVRIFPDLPSLRSTRGPLVGLPFRHPINELAYGYEANNGFLMCRVSRGGEGDYEYVYLPRFEAEAHQERRPGPSHLYYGWVVPQWLLSFDDPPPSPDAWWITVISDERGSERWSSAGESPWSKPGASGVELPSEYEWPDEFYVRADVGPGMSCWVTRASNGLRDLQTFSTRHREPVQDEQARNSNTAVELITATQGGVLCIAAAQTEFTAVLAQMTQQFGRGSTQSLSGGAGYAVRFIDPEAQTVWYVASLPFQGETEAGVGVQSFVTALAPNLILMVGMCMGMPARKLQIGTVVVPNEVIGFDHQRLTLKGTTYRPHGVRVDSTLYKLARIVGTQNFPYPVVLDKGLASATIKIEDASGSLVHQIDAAFPDVAAYDMEGWGFYRATDGKQCLWIKAVADSGESQENSGDEHRAKKSLQAEVTLNALDFAIRLVREHHAAHRDEPK